MIVTAHDRPGPRQVRRSSCSHSRSQREDVLDRGERVHLKTLWSETKSTPPWLHGLQRSSRQPASTRAANEPCVSQRVERVLRAARVVLAGAREQRPERPAPDVHGSDRRVLHAPPQDLVDALAQPVEPARLDRLGQARPGDEHVVAARRDALEPRAPRLAQLALEPVARHRGAERLRHREPQPRLAAPVLAREPVEDEVAAREGAAVAIDGLEIARAREAVAALHAGGGRSGRQALAAPRAAALEDRLAGARGHPRSEAVPALSPTHVGLIGALHSPEEDE